MRLILEILRYVWFFNQHCMAADELAPSGVMTPTFTVMIPFVSPEYMGSVFEELVRDEYHPRIIAFSVVYTVDPSANILYPLE